MAVESLFGGSSANSGSSKIFLSDEAIKKLLELVLFDYAGTSAVDFGSGQLLNGTGPGGEKQGAFVPGTSSTQGPITNGDLIMQVDIPAGIGVTFAGKDGQTSDAARIYLNNAISSYFPPQVVANDPAASQQQLFLLNAVEDLLGSLPGSKDISVRLIDFLSKKGGAGNPSETVTTTNPQVSSDTFVIADNAPPAAGVVPTEVSFDAGTSKGKQVLAFNLSQLGPDRTLVVKNTEAVLLGGPGSFRVDGAQDTRINSDNSAQNISGGAGNDTLVGGGNDTLSGGAGADVFAFNSNTKGRFTITDFNKASDTLAFKWAGATTFAQLQSAVTKGTYVNGNMTYELGPDMSITLVGIGPFDITSSMIKFTY